MHSRRTNRRPTSLLRTYHRRGWRRGVELLEFALIIPFLFFLVCFSIDMGNMVFLSGLIHDAAFVSARTGAQFGEAGTSATGPGGQGATGPSYNAFANAAASLPGGLSEVQSYTVVSPTTANGDCASSGTNQYVTVRVSFHMNFITPGLYTMLSLYSSGFTLNATGVARCEVVRF